MIDLGYLARYRILPDRRWQRVVAATFMPMEAATRTRLVLHHFVAPTEPVLYASNSGHKYDFLTFRSAMWARDLPIATLTKAKNYHVAWMRPVMENTGVVPLASKGYVILRDALGALGRRPTEDEYRALRDHLDRDEPLPDTAAFVTLRTRPRDILGRHFDPAVTSLRAAWQGVYSALLGEALRLCREAVAAGHSIHIYPEGTVSSRLSGGRIGAMMFAQALGLPVVPVGISGARDAFRGNTPFLRGGAVDFRFGPAYRPDLTGLPDDFRAFDPTHERRDRATLQRATDDLMDRINGLLASEHQRRDDHVPDGTRGTKRFL